MHWDSMPAEAIQQAVQQAVARNAQFVRDRVLGFPGSVLDTRVFPPHPVLMAHAWLSSLHNNPNHIGCHTTGHSEAAFEGTQAIERDVIRICAEQILGAQPGGTDGYVASGGTESNIQALWAHRNGLRKRGHRGRIGVLCSEDTHYSVDKGADLLGLPLYRVPVDPDRRSMHPDAIDQALRIARSDGLTALVVVLNLGTTMFGSIDDAEAVLPRVETSGFDTRVHVDAAFGGFIYPFTSNNRLDFTDPRIHSFTLDAHKMLQAPYGTGIHLIRKGMIDDTSTESATYVRGLDCTLIGSRSGANAIAVWMILMTYGSEGGRQFCAELVTRTDRLEAALGQHRIRYFRQPGMNLIAMRIADLPPGLVERHVLVPDRHDDQAVWAKAVVMPHVTNARMDALIADLGNPPG